MIAFLTDMAILFREHPVTMGVMLGTTVFISAVVVILGRKARW